MSHVLLLQSTRVPDTTPRRYAYAFDGGVARTLTAAEQAAAAPAASAEAFDEVVSEGLGLGVGGGFGGARTFGSKPLLGKRVNPAFDGALNKQIVFSYNAGVHEKDWCVAALAHRPRGPVSVPYRVPRPYPSMQVAALTPTHTPRSRLPRFLDNTPSTAARERVKARRGGWGRAEKRLRFASKR